MDTKYPLFIITQPEQGKGMMMLGAKFFCYEEPTTQMIGFKRLFLIDDNRTPTSNRATRSSMTLLPED